MNSPENRLSNVYRVGADTHAGLFWEVTYMASEEELLLRQMPHSVEAEQSVLGAMLIDARCVPDVIEELKP